ncbi:MAG: hypothetical protein NWE98_10210 [Candidatus Bathyarchaeota archaeon]|nr:hypothetical protein [Candidatus Bathyarchaeota archaeon]
MKYKSLHHTAKHIDRLIDETIKSKKIVFLTQNELKDLILNQYPYFYVASMGWHKIVFGNCSVDRKIVLKVGNQKSIENDHRVYKRVPENVRHKFFAKIYWHTKYCLLQEYGLPAHVTAEQLNRIRREVYKYGIIDVKAENLKNIDGTIKIIDANATSIRLPTVMRKIDETKPKLPKKLVAALRKVSSLTIAR